MAVFGAATFQNGTLDFGLMTQADRTDGLIETRSACS